MSAGAEVEDRQLWGSMFLVAFLKNSESERSLVACEWASQDLSAFFKRQGLRSAVRLAAIRI